MGAFPGQPDDVPWPTDEWATADWPAGIDKASIDAATDTAFAGGGPERVRAVVIVYRGAIVYERYNRSGTEGPYVVMPSYSLAKSITSAFVGILVRDRKLDIDSPAPIPEWHVDPADPRAAISIEQMLHMATGMAWQDGYADPSSNISQMLELDDMAAYAAAQTLTTEPGTTFEYNTGTTTLLARIVGEAVGADRDDIRAFMDRELFDRIGMRTVQTAFDAAGTWEGGTSADATARDFARFGLLYARGGLWDGVQILPESWVEFSRTPSDANPEYGAQWWLDPARPGVSYAIGVRGQVITVDPVHDLVIVQLSTVGGQLPLTQTEEILDAFAAAD